jgi:hypothetical protein
MELLFGIYGRCFLAVGDILWAYFFGCLDIEDVVKNRMITKNISIHHQYIL